MKRFLAALIAAATVTAPASARVDPGTTELLRTVDEYVNVSIDPPRCDSGEFMGSWSPRTTTLTVCTQGSVDAEDHDTVRHEVWHIVQMCKTPSHAKHLYPVIRDTQDWERYVLSNISQSQIDSIIRNYPEHHVIPEIEAYVMAAELTAKQVQNEFIRHCT